MLGCAPETGKRQPAKPAKGVTAGRVLSDSAETRQCLSALQQRHIQYTMLKDRWFDRGCSALSSVRLIDIGTPVSRLTAVSCPLASHFADWVRDVAQPEARRMFGVAIARIDSFGSYDCRPVNGVDGNALSEHGRANALDIGGFVLADGRKISVKTDWNGPDERYRQFLRVVHQGACRRFQVVLGPDANHWHHDHLHFDMGNGPYCR